jgi:hypothetical protein
MKRKIAGLLFIMAFLLSAMEPTLVNLATANPLPPPPILNVYVRNDGTVDPATAPIQRTGNTYTFTNDLTNATIRIQRDNIVINGAGYKLQGNGPMWNTAITLENRSNVVIKNIDIKDYSDSISLTACSNIIIYRNNMLTAGNIILDSSVGNQIVGNNIVGQETGYGYCVHIENGAANNLIMGNNFSDAGAAVTIYSSSGKNNTFYLNNFFGNSNNVVGWIEDEEANSWDNGEKGNYWSDYQGSDADGDGVGDTPYVINDGRPDRYPLMAPFDVDSVTVEMPEWTFPLSLQLINPENTTYTSANVTLQFTVNKETSWISYSLDGGETITIAGNTTIDGLSNGLHNVTVYAADLLENIWNSETTYFTVEVPEPFPATLVAVASGASVTVIGVGLLIYFRKRSENRG